MSQHITLRCLLKALSSVYNASVLGEKNSSSRTSGWIRSVFSQRLMINARIFMKFSWFHLACNEVLQIAKLTYRSN